MKKLFITILLAVSVPILFWTYSLIHKSECDVLFAANADALADNENGWGLLWEKYWTECQFSQIIITNSSEYYAAGTILPYTQVNVDFLENHAISYTITSGTGQKSYCYDGWSFCKHNDCR